MATYQWEDYYAKLPGAVSTRQRPGHRGHAHGPARHLRRPRRDHRAAGRRGQTRSSSTEADFAPTVWQGGLYKDKRYGIPLDMHPLGFYYNKTVMQKAGLDPNKPPTTKDDYVAALTELKKAGHPGLLGQPVPVHRRHDRSTRCSTSSAAPCSTRDGAKATFNCRTRRSRRAPGWST